MKSIILSAVAFLLAGCTTVQQEGGQQGGAQAMVVTLPSADNWRASYICGDGQRIDVTHDQPAGLLLATRSGEKFTLQEQVGQNPPKFVTGSDSVVVEKDGLTLLRGKAARQTCKPLPNAPVTGSIWGTLSKMDRMALPAGTRAKVLLVDAGRADAPSIEIASTALETVGNQVPLHFLLTYAPERVQPRGMIYRLQARIEAPDGTLMYITDTATFVLESAAPQVPVELRLVRVSGQ